MNAKQRMINLTSAMLLIITMLFPTASFAGTSDDNGGCPPIICSNIANPTLLHNPSFEILGPDGSPTFHSGPIPYPFPSSAAAGWSVHNDNFGSFITTELVPSTRPGGGARMIHVTTGGTEGGLVQAMSGRISSIVASVWVYAVSGYVVFQTSAGSDGPFAKTTTTGQWELLQLYNDGSTPVNWFVLYNQAAGGGEFYAELACATRWKNDYSYLPGLSKPESIFGDLNAQVPQGHSALGF